MAKLLYRIGKSAAHNSWKVLLAWLVILAVAVSAFLMFAGKMTSAVSIPNTPSQQVIDELAKAIPEAAGGTGAIVLHNEKGFSEQQQSDLTKAFKELESFNSVDAVADPFLSAEQLAEKKIELAAAKEQLASGEEQLSAAAKQLAAGEQQLSAAKTQLEQGNTQLTQAKQQVALTGADPNLVPQIQAQEAQLQAAKAQVTAQEAQFNAAKAELEQQQAKAVAAASQIKDGEQLLALAEGTEQVSADATTAVLTVVFNKNVHSVEEADRAAILEHLEAAVPDGVDVLPSSEISSAMPEILGVGEIVGVVIAFIVLLVLMRAFVPAVLPLLTAVIGVAIGVIGALSLSGVVEMMSVTPTLGVMLGLAVGIDYALFIINRHRTQLRSGIELYESIGLANGTSGNAVVFAGSTVIIALLGLNVTGIPFLAVMGNVAAFAVLVAVALAVTLTPALLGLAKDKVLTRKERLRRAAATAAEVEAENTKRDAEIKPLKTWKAVLTTIVAVAALLAVALPAAGMRLGLPTALGEDPASVQYQGYKLTAEKFGEGANSPLLVVAEITEVPTDEAAMVAEQLRIAEGLAAVENVKAVAPIAVSEDQKTLAFRVLPDEGPSAASTEIVVHDLRALDGELATHIGVAGNASAAIDIANKLADVLPIYLILVVGLSLVILIVVFRSLLVPLTATVGFVLSLLAAYGAITAIYQNGFLADFFQVHDPEPVLAFLPIIVLGILFGLAMDYQLFIASGMREAYVHGASAKKAVQLGLVHGRAVVIAAALIMISVFGGFIFAHSAMIRPIGFGLAFGVLVDAFVVRLLLIPAVMHLLGKSAWWIPKWLDKVLPNFDVEGASLVSEKPADPLQNTEKIG